MTIGDDPMGEVIGREAHGDAIAQEDADAVLTHTPSEAGADLGAGVGFDIEIAASEDVGDYSIELKMIRTGHGGFVIISL